jgi:outer membrane protein OmpA-like peptidoglycan-associated protein
VPSDLSFDIGRADLKPALRPLLDQFAQGLDGTVHVLVVVSLRQGCLISAEAAAT